MASKKVKAIRFFEDEMSGRRYDWSGGKRVGSGNTDSASVPERRKFERKKKASVPKTVKSRKPKVKYEEDQATYRDFGRTYGGLTDATSVGTRKRRESGNFSYGEKPKKAVVVKKK
jgi:hypothetical protein